MRSVKVLTFPGCPNHRATVELVRKVARDLGVEVEVGEVLVLSPEDAAHFRFLGSPTVQVDGTDIEPERRRDAAYSISCRIYGVSGIPSREMIASALVEVAP